MEIFSKKKDDEEGNEDLKIDSVLFIYGSTVLSSIKHKNFYGFIMKQSCPSTCILSPEYNIFKKMARIIQICIISLLGRICMHSLEDKKTLFYPLKCYLIH